MEYTEEFVQTSDGHTFRVAPDGFIVIDPTGNFANISQPALKEFLAELYGGTDGYLLSIVRDMILDTFAKWAKVRSEAEQTPEGLLDATRLYYERTGEMFNWQTGRFE